jgi:hypothetical protein
MITEGICLDVVRAFRGCRGTITLTVDLDDNPGASPRVSKSSYEDAMPPGRLIRYLLPKYSLADIETAIRWLEIGEYVTPIGQGVILPRAPLSLTPKGVAFADTGRLEPAERDFVYQENPYAPFVARQFAPADDELFAFLKDNVLTPIGVKCFDGQVDGIEAFRGEILRKIRLARFFVCVLTHRLQLQNGRFASSVWLYQEIGAAVALGKKPLILVEEGLDEHYAGELQKNYEYVPFSRVEFEEPFRAIGKRILNDLTANHIPVGAGNQKEGT